MQLICDGLDLSDAVLKVSKAIATITTNPILEGVRLVAEENELTLSATDLELSIEKKIHADIKEEGEIVVPGKFFSDFVKKLTNEKIAEHFNYHPYHLSRLMKARTNKTLHNYLIDFRLHMAKNYLTTTNYNVTKIAEKTGFASYAYFIKIFREKVGISPLQYRKTHLSIGF